MSAQATRDVGKLIAQAREIAYDRNAEAAFEALLVLADEVEHYQRALVAHHNFATLSDDVIREYDWRECPVCKRAREEGT